MKKIKTKSDGYTKQELLDGTTPRPF
jgi:hypothetical protein